MDEYTVETFANRDEPIPVVSTPNERDQQVAEETSKDTKRGNKLSTRYWKDKFHDAQAELGKTNTGAGLSLQDRLLTKLLQQVIPIEDVDLEPSMDGAAASQVARPAFSLPLMTNNFRRFNARIGIVFVFQSRVIKLLSWRNPTHTVSLLFVYSFICLDPYLLFILPFAVFLLFIMVPGFLARHPPPPPSASTSSTTAYYSYEGPALAPAKTVKPVSETSKDFFHNMRDLQNSMADFATMHDALVAFLSPTTNFSNEILSSTLFLLLTFTAAALFLTAHLIPWRFIFLLGGNGALIATHPKVEAFVIEFTKQLTEERGLAADGDDGGLVLFGVHITTSPPALVDLVKSTAAISLDTYPEEREVEIFELQHKTFSAYSPSPEWQSFLFTPTPYDPLSPSRIAGDRPRGARFFEDIRPPPGWTWKGKKWELDLECREWVMERMVTGVEFEVPGGAGGGNNDGNSSSHTAAATAAAAGVNEEVGGWVWDLPFHPPDEGMYGEAEHLAYGDSWHAKGSSTSESRDTGSARLQKGKAPAHKKDWEEGTITLGSNGTGEWRRRRWVRVVQRITVHGKGGEG
ncbi:hypothetical protein AJ80_02827 [Polytolypa hystricis UAMH7299]|uniref:TECPR1-like DysF domain-containing protein n=1 Tax=Polytolypa hystricis (strain UAMH7299) TaxID=1447883 RepID=A0A2B7YG47_POLH7|nr:hypothetical protein AJ80_02827 [Polytolypa hystricis UAMH7299]